MCAKIVVANRIHDSVEQQLRVAGELTVNTDETPWDLASLTRHCSDAFALMAFMTERIDGAFLDACPGLKIIAGALKGYNNIDVAACTDRGVAVTVVPDLLTEPTAELTLGLIISVMRNLGAGDRLLRSGAFNGWRPTLYGSSLNGSTVGILGAGAVGQATLRMLGGFDCERLYYDPVRLAPEIEERLGATCVSEEVLVRDSDVLVLAVHLKPDNRHLVNDAYIRRMKPGAFLINPARGSLVDEAAVADALESGHLSGYAADTFELEDWQLSDRPRGVDPRLLASDKTVFTPHVGSGVRTVREAIEAEAAHNILDMLAGVRPRGLVNPAVWSAESNKA